MSVIFAFAIAFVMICCESPSASTTDTFTVTMPDSATAVEASEQLEVEWQYAEGSSVRISLFNNQGLVEVLDSTAENDGTYLVEQVSDLWPPSNLYRVQIIDAQGNEAWSQFFVIKERTEILPLPDPVRGDSPSR